MKNNTTKLSSISIYLTDEKDTWLKKQAKKAKLTYSTFVSALIEDKMNTDENFCPSPTFVNLSSGESAKRK